MKSLAVALGTALALSAASAAQAGMQITEWMYDGSEFIEFTNVGNTSVNMTGWSFDDDSRVAGTVSLSAFGIVAPGESVILAEASAANFRTAWNLAASVDVIGGNSTNLGRNDEINLYDNTNTLVDRLTYGDQSYSGSARAQGKSVSIPLADLAFTTVRTIAQGWVLASNADSFGSYTSIAPSSGNIGNPGKYLPFTPTPVVPEPASLGLLTVLGLGFLRRR
jgi:predicted extracellular nuclease